jgi:hypothetical protein
MRASKRRRAEARARLERGPEGLSTVPAGGLGHPGVEDAATEAQARRGVRRWLRPVMTSIDHDRIVAATKSSLLIAVNALMLSVTALALFRGPLDGHRWWALLPLALTNMLSLAFATFAAQAGERPAELEEWWEQEVAAHEVHRWEQARRMLAAELDARGAALSISRLHLRTAYRLLVGGLMLSALIFAASLGVSAHFEALNEPSPAADVRSSGITGAGEPDAEKHRPRPRLHPESEASP